MSKAISTTTTTAPGGDPHNLAISPRRGLLGGFLALGAAATAVGAVAAPPAGGDAALLALHVEQHAAYAALRGAVDAYNQAERLMFQEPGNPPLTAAAAAANDAVDDASEAEEAVKLAMADLPAMTMAGLMVKALVLADDVNEGATAAGYAIAASVREDAARLGLLPVMAAEPAPAPDADLIRLCAQHAANAAAFTASDADDGPLWNAYAASRDAIHDAKPQTLAGMVAKARAAKAEATTLDGEERPEHGPAETWAWDLVNDLVRLHGGEA
jgi:hypothetical protein